MPSWSNDIERGEIELSASEDRGTTSRWRVLGGLAVVTVALYAAFSGVLSVLLPRQVAELDPEGKVAALAVITSVSFAATAVAQPIIGALSDRTRSRWGRRLPWMVAGAIVGGAALGAAGGSTSLAALTVAWAVAQFALNGTDVASTAYLVDRFVPRRRGRAVAVVGVSAILGGAAGAVLAGRLDGSTAAAYWIFAGVIAVAVVLFAVLVRDPPERAGRTLRPSVGAFLRGFWVNPRQHPDFARVLAWRLFFTLAYGSVHGYLLYLLTDFIGTDPDTAAQLVGGVTALAGGGVVVAILAGGWFSDRIGARKPLLIGAGAIVVVADTLPLLLPSVSAILVLAVALGLALGLSIVCGTALGSEVIPDPGERAGGGLGTLNLATNLGQAFAPLLGAAVIDIAGGYGALFVLSIASMVIATALIITVRGAR